MAIDVASPGANEAALRDALAGRLGLRLLASTTISSPVAYFDLALPAGYAEFIAGFVGLKLATADSICFAVSTDGATFLCDTDNFDTYRSRSSVWEDDGSGTGSYGGVDSLAYIATSQAVGAQSIGGARVFIDPGSSDRSFFARTEALLYQEGTPPTIVGAKTITQLYGTATVAPVYARIVKLRFMPLGNFDANPPTSGETFDGGSYFLWGVPTP